MTAKEKLHQAVEELSEEEAREALDYIAARRGGQDRLTELLDGAPVDDEPTTPEEDEGVREAQAEVERGETISLDELRRELS
jgi:hypothetical protein